MIPGGCGRRTGLGRLALGMSLLLAGCASPVERLDEQASRAGLVPVSLAAGGFRLAGYRNRHRPDGRLHVYLDSDGTPWITRTRIARDPTPRHPLALRLLALDPAPALYLARPCYNGQAQAPGCTPRLWTSGRYSETVVAVMAEALRQVIRAESARAVTLIGYSGGGVLAWLLAPRLPQTRTLVTLAANLAIDRWTDRHGYSRLTDSLNPAQGPPLPPDIQQWHWVGERDVNVPPELIATLGVRLGPGACIQRVDADHACCWPARWPELLRQFSTDRSLGCQDSRDE